MHSKTRGIVLNSLQYGESKLIIKLYTEQFGLRSYLLPRSSSARKGSGKASLLQALQPVEIVFKKVKSDSSLAYITEMSAAAHLTQAYTNIIKSSIIIFLNEVLLKTIKEEEENSNLFQFLFHAIVMIDLMEDGYENFHLFFLKELTKHIGFYPEAKKNNNDILFNLKEGRFTGLSEADAFSLNEEESALIETLFSNEMNSVSNFKFNYSSRKKILGALLRYYELHISYFSEPKSLLVLETLLS